jgi:chaperonin GroES
VATRVPQTWNPAAGEKPDVRKNSMSMADKSSSKSLDVIEPVGLRVLVRKDEERRTTKGGIHLPDDAKIPVITGRIVALSSQVENDPDYPLEKYDKVILDPRNSIPVDFEQDNKLYLVPVEDVVAVIRQGKRTGD